MLSPKVFVFNKNRGFLKVLGGLKNAKSGIYTAPYSYHGEYTALTMVNTQRGSGEKSGKERKGEGRGGGTGVREWWKMEALVNSPW